MLQVNVSQMLKGNVGDRRIIAIDDDVAIDENCSARVTGEAKLTRTNRSILVQANVTTAVPAECARCLERYSCRLQFKFEEEFFPTTDVNSGAALPEPEEIDSFTIDEELTLDLTEAIRQYSLTALPMKPLCRTDCPGIQV
jgi:uncharacterized protein